MYDYLIVGAGLTGATLAWRLKTQGKSVIVIDQRSYIGGNCYTEYKNGIYVHKHGPHIFHTNNKQVWNFINKFDELEQYQYQPLAYYKGSYYNLPFNMHTFYQIYSITNVDELNKIQNLSKVSTNLEELGINNLGQKMYDILVKGYSSKQWGLPCSEINSNILSRLPIRLTWNNNYFDDKYQGIPEFGYTNIIQKMLLEIPVKLNTKFNLSKHYNIANKILYCGSIDELLNYKFGKLPYRSLIFKETEFEESQGIAVINYTEQDIPYTRCIDHKMFLKSTQNLKQTIKTYEYPCVCDLNNERYYPIFSEQNCNLYNQYLKELHRQYPKIIPCGRLGLYKYINMDEAINLALNLEID